MRPGHDADHLHILLKLRMNATILSFRQGPSWRLQGQRYQRLIREVAHYYIRDQSPRSWFDPGFLQRNSLLRRYTGSVTITTASNSHNTKIRTALRISPASIGVTWEVQMLPPLHPVFSKIVFWLLS